MARVNARYSIGIMLHNATVHTNIIHFM